MNKEDIINIGIEEEKAIKVLELYNSIIKNYVSKDELNIANNTIKTLNQTLKDFDGIDVNKLKQDIQGWEEKYNNDITNIKKNNAIDIEILKAKGKNIKAIKALIDIDKVKLNNEGILEGLDIESIKKSDSYLFDIEESKTEGTGTPKGSSNLSNENSSLISAFRIGAGLK